MAEVIDFGKKRKDRNDAVKRKRRSAALQRVKSSGAYVKRGGRFMGRGLLRMIVALLRTIRFGVFLILFTLRKPVTILLNLSGIALLFALLIFACYDHGPKQYGFLAMIGGMGFGSMAASWFYDELVLALSPRPIVLI